MIIDGNWLAAGWTVPTASDSIQGDGVVCSWFNVVDGGGGLASGHSEFLDRAISSCLSIGDSVIAHRDGGGFPTDEQAGGGGSDDLQISRDIGNRGLLANQWGALLSAINSNDGDNVLRARIKVGEGDRIP